MARKKVTLQMIAERAGVSTVTVSNVLSGKKGAGEDVRRQVTSLAEEMGYIFPSREAEGDRKENLKAYLIGVVIAERYVKDVPSFYMDIYRQVASEAARRSCLTLLEVVDEREEKLQTEPFLFGTTELKGILVIGEMNGAFLDRIRKNFTIPVVCVDFYDVDREMDFVATDGFDGMRAITARLLELGYRKIAFLGNPHATASIMDRYMGYCKAMAWAHIPAMEPISDRRERYSSSLEFELPEELPEAFVCNCEKSARLLLEKLRNRGVRVPEEVVIASFDRIHGEKADEAEWLTYESEEDSMARIAVTTLMKRIEGKKGPAGIRMVEGRLREGKGMEKGKETPENEQYSKA